MEVLCAEGGLLSIEKGDMARFVYKPLGWEPPLSPGGMLFMRCSGLILGSEPSRVSFFLPFSYRLLEEV